MAVAEPPVGWKRGIGYNHRLRIARRVVEADFLAVDPRVRSQRLGHRLLAHLRAHYRAQGYRIVRQPAEE
ncbi:GNAT family N-acetyltransferase [Streptomyces sp. NPDC004134]|uniref:GNAT family N-acetyltransferase n=1 Tax=Streptomyces sp. NPDC004134 TaxID=3364691 RepID=UPI0036B51B45